MIFIGIDSGTQSTKAVALDADSGAVLASAQAGYDLVGGLPAGHLEQNPADWIDAVRTTVGQCLTALGKRRSELAGIGVSGQQHGLVALDADDQVVRAAKLWCDTSTADQCAQFAAQFGGDRGLIELAGNPIRPGYTIPKLLWLKQNEPENFARTRSLLLPHDYINFCLTGTKRMEYGDASGTGALDIRRREWCRELLDFIDPRAADLLPALGSSLDVHGTLCGELAEAWEVSGEILVSAGGGDNMMGAIGTGNVTPGVVTASLGTSGTLYTMGDKPAIDPGGEVAAFCDSTDHWLPLVCTMNVTVVTEAVRTLFGMSLDALDTAVASVEPGADGLCFLPYLNGERVPNLPSGCGVLHGLHTQNMSPAHIARAAMEGATLGLAYGLERFRAMDINPTEIRLTGGGSNSAAWRQIAADVFGTQVVTLATSESAGLGAAIQAARCAMGYPDYAELCERYVTLDESTRCAPVAAKVAVYRELLEKQAGLTQNLHAGGHL